MAVAFAIVSAGLIFDRLLVLTFERTYYRSVPRESIFWVGWPVTALVLGMLLSLRRYYILATALLLNTLVQAGTFLAYLGLYSWNTIWTEPGHFFRATWLYQLLFIAAFLTLKRQVAQLDYLGLKPKEP